MTFNRVTAMEYLNENLDVLEDYTKLPEDDHRIIKVRELFQVDTKKERVHKNSVRAEKQGVVEIYASAADFARFIGVVDAQVGSALLRGIRIRGYDIRKVPFNEQGIRVGADKEKPILKVTKNGVTNIYTSITRFCEDNNISRQMVYKGMKSGKLYKGYLFERINK